MVVQNNFDSKKLDESKAYNAKQMAYTEMIESQSKVNALGARQQELYTQIGATQEELDAEKEKADAAWAQYNAEQLTYKAAIGGVLTSIRECNALEENLRLMSQNRDEDPDKTIVYAEGAKFFAQLALAKMQEHDELLTKKRSLIRPDNLRVHQLINVLKNMRAEQSNVLEDFHAAKNNYSAKKAEFDRLNARYHRIVENGEVDDELSVRPKKLEFDERLLMIAKIPEEHWDNCEIEQRADGKIDIYYGGARNRRHGHVVLENNEVSFSREPALIDA